VRQIYERNLAYEDPKTVFLGVEGEAIRKTSLEKDFERLVRASGHTDVQACLSMFRHRFITYEVMVHLKEFMGSAGKTRQLMTDSDYRSILKRITAKTGHGSPESLWHYIDLAWEEMDVWAHVDRHLEHVYASDTVHQELLDLQRTLRGNPELPAAELLDVVERLSAIAVDVENRRSPQP
jgi:hypothetical protein